MTTSPAPPSAFRQILAHSATRNLAAGVLMIAVVGIAIAALFNILSETSWDEIRAAFGRIGIVNLAASVALTTLSYLVLTGYDVLALRSIGRKVPYRTAALASFTSYIFSHNFGFAVLTGGLARYRIYRRKGLSLGEVAQVIALAGITFWFGVFLMLGIALIAIPGVFAQEGWQVPYRYQAWGGSLILAGLVGYLVLLHFRAGRPMRLFGWSLVLPTVGLALGQFALAMIDITLATAALFVLVPGLDLATFPAVLVGYITAFVSGLITHAPGGVGVFEAVMLVALHDINRATLFAALLVYRFIYYLLPLAVGLILFALHEARGRRHQARATQPRNEKPA
ncbi:MAG: lysylphosphatidylglycerol synthase domain-containing protein [Pseudomonadota bacterium]|uniref:Inner membrane protein YbhQ n=1 Tax=hydrothermal vent metagenome TaxID=652676 RepID=A0A160TN05_9ZZZZ